MRYQQISHAFIPAMQELGLHTWSQYRDKLTDEHWESMQKNVGSASTYEKLLERGSCEACFNEADELVGMSFWVQSGVGDAIYDAAWCQLRFVTVRPDVAGQGIARRLVQRCIDAARDAGEQTMALHTSEVMSTARGLYERMGFIQIRDLPVRYGWHYWLFTMELH